ncbi:MAG: lytic transglycosylase domain-containing protein, partial [Sphingomonadaceae bacterium]|nr:lytic transglycosylase domain-containing protein [Sphingomonadaceae bacterium]
MSSRLRFAALGLMLAGSAAAALTPGMRALYTARLAETAAGRFSTLPLSPEVNPATDPLMDAVVQWDRLRRDNGPATFAEIAAFLRAHHGWPAETTLRRRAERMIDDSVPMAARLAYFRDYPPLSAYARFRLAEARRAGGDATLAAADARAAWTAGGLDAVSEVQLLGEFGTVLTPADHAARLDRLLWRGETSAAQRMLPLVPADARALGAARLAAKLGDDSQIAALTPAQRGDAGLAFDRANAAKRRGDLVTARQVLADYAGAPGLVADPEAWLKLRLEMARGAMRDGQNDLAYRIAAGHAAFPLGRLLDTYSLGERQALIDTEWLAGWIALRRLNKPVDALTHFERVTDAAQTPVSQARGQYWSGRAAEAAGQDARPYYAAAATHADYYYGQLAAEHLGPTLTLPAAPPVAATPAARATFEGDELVRIVRDLGEIGDRGRQTLFMKALVERAETPEQQRLLVDLGRSL